VICQCQVAVLVVAILLASRHLSGEAIASETAEPTKVATTRCKRMPVLNTGCSPRVVEGSVISSERDDALLPIGGADDKWPLPRAAMWDKRACTASVVNMIQEDGNSVNFGGRLSTDGAQKWVRLAKKWVTTRRCWPVHRYLFLRSFFCYCCGKGPLCGDQISLGFECAYYSTNVLLCQITGGDDLTPSPFPIWEGEMIGLHRLGVDCCQRMACGENE
jgi:hypothetical protein